MPQSEGENYRLLRRNLVRARKAYPCAACEDQINPRDRHEVTVVLSTEQTVLTIREHYPHCPSEGEE